MGFDIQLVEPDDYETIFDNYLEIVWNSKYLSEQIPTIENLANFDVYGFISKTLLLIYEDTTGDASLNYYTREEVIEAIDRAAEEDYEMLNEMHESLSEIIGYSQGYRCAIEDHIDKKDYFNFERIFIENLISFALDHNLFVQVTMGDATDYVNQIFLNSPLQKIW